MQLKTYIWRYNIFVQLPWEGGGEAVEKYKMDMQMSFTFELA